MTGKIEGTMCALRECAGCHENVWVLLADGKCPDCGGRSKRSMHYEPHEHITQVKAQLEPETVEARQALVKVTPLTIQNAQQEAAFAKFLDEAKARWKKLDDQEKLMTRPALEGVKRTREFFADPKASWQAIIDLLKEKIGDWITRQALDTEAAYARAAELSAAGDASGAQAALATLDTTPANDGAQVSHPWGFEVKALELLPVAFLLPNLTAIREEMRRQLKEAPEETPTIAGVTFARGIQISARGKRAK